MPFAYTGAGIALLLSAWLGVKYHVLEETAYDPWVLAGRRAMVVGASSGIGREMVVQLSSNGALVIAVARRQGDLRELAAMAPDRITPLVADAAKSADCERLADAASEHSLDYLFLNHAFFAEQNWVTEPDMDLLRRTFDVNFFSYVDLATRLLPSLNKRGGSLAVTSSGAGLSGVALQSGYSASKHALHGFFESLRQDLNIAGSSVSVTLAVVGNTDVERRAGGADSYYGKLPMASSRAVAARIIMGAVLREREIDAPNLEIGQLRIMRHLAPGYTDSVVIKVATNHWCTSRGPWAALILCSLP